MTIKRVRKNLKKSNTGLRSQVEVLRENPSGGDSADADVLSYVNEFIQSYSKIPPLPATSLLTKEDAQRALVVLEEAQARVTSHLKTARALKRLLQSQTDE